MIFNSIEFLFFLLVVYTAYRILPFRGQNTILLIASYVFYGWWNERLLFLILLTTTVDFCCSLMIDRGQLTRKERLIPSIWITLASLFFVTINWDAVHLAKGTIEWSQLLPSSWLGWFVFIGTVGTVLVTNLLYPRSVAIEPNQRKKFFLIASITINLGILCVFKYFNFFVDSAEAAINSLGLQTDLWSLNVLLPVGISFYTFQTMSYTVDVYRGSLKSTNKFFDFALFVSFFPQLVAGPIVRASELLPQLLQPRTLTFDQTIRGLYLILFGLFKKVAIADGLAGSVNAIYGASGAVSWIDVVVATLLFTFQIYCDFSGYSDIARGVAKLFGVELMLNFHLPYFSKTPSEFWRRWHISLSTWLRDYLYISLGGNRKGNLKTYRNLMLTMALGGLWHGAAWNYVVWGIYQGTLLCIYRFLGLETFKKAGDPNPSLLRSLGMGAIFFVLTCYGWLLFRAVSFAQIASFTQILFTDIGNFSLSMPKPTLPALLGLPLLVLYEVLEYRAATAQFYYRYSALIRGAFYAALTMLIVMGTSNAPAQFIYFQF